MKFPGTLLYQGFRQAIRNTQLRPWVILWVLIYLISPIDLLPSFFLGFGELDDVILVGLLCSELLQLGWQGKTVLEKDPQPQPSSSQVIDVKATPVEGE